MSGGRESSSSSNDSMVWGGQSPFLLGLYQQGAEQLQNFAPNQDIANLSMAAAQQQLGANPAMNPYLDQMTQVYRDQLDQGIQQIGGQAGLTGGYGGGRQGLLEANALQDYGTNVGNFLGGQYQQDMNRAVQQQQFGLQSLPQVLQLQPWQQQQQALQNQANIIGRPTVLGEGSSGSSGFSVGVK
jgi:hypothetical protein